MYDGKKIGAVIPAAGMGSRMKTSEKKQFMLLENREILEWTLIHILKSETIDMIWVVVPSEFVRLVEDKVANWIEKYAFRQPIYVIEGGKNRQESVYKAIKCIPESFEWIVVHDGVRPFVDSSWLDINLVHMSRFDSIVSALQSTDTLKIVDESHIVKQTLNRDEIWSVQTPQVFRREVLKAVHEKAIKDDFFGTDDASLLEKYNYKVLLCEGEKSNIKITSPMDLVFGRAILDWKNRSES